ncbi:MAG: AIR synthase related protein [Bdellovibrionaceae bacterium]|nr:AIR synthase related protein [Pseudobdellovibrionaceae bacterium]
MIKNKEIETLTSLIGTPLRSPWQKNFLNESDVEILKLKKSSLSKNLAITTDIVSDEIHWGLYKSPFLIGWMSVVVSLSDLAASATSPLGFVMGTHWGKEFNFKQKKEFYRGVKEALKVHRTFLLGGDTSSGKETVISSTVLGVGMKKVSPLKRTKINVGDEIYALGSFGNGPALSLRVLLGVKEKFFPEKLFLPIVKFLKNTKHIKASIDVSDGLASSLCIFSEINQVSFDIDIPENFFTPESVQFCHQARIPQTALFFAEHGDYQLLVAIDPKKRQKFLKLNPQAIKIAVASGKRKAHRIKNLNNEWIVFELDFLYKAPKSTIFLLRKTFKSWLKLARKANL